MLHQMFWTVLFANYDNVATTTKWRHVRCCIPCQILVSIPCRIPTSIIVAAWMNWKAMATFQTHGWVPFQTAQNDTLTLKEDMIYEIDIGNSQRLTEHTSKKIQKFPESDTAGRPSRPHVSRDMEPRDVGLCHWVRRWEIFGAGQFA